MAFTGADLRALRLRHRASVSAIAKELEVHRHTWTKMEADVRAEVPKTLRLALAAWTRGLPAMGEDGH